MISNLYADIGYHSISKFGNTLCGDHVEMVEQEDGSIVIVLADGLGSGVKASILSTLTSTIISRMIAENLPIEDCVKTIAAALPICSVRNLAYSTFTIIRIMSSNEVEIIQYDSPDIILIRDGKHLEIPFMTSVIEDKSINFLKTTLQENDILIAVSDGVIHAGVGPGMSYAFGWKRENIISYMESFYHVGFTAKTLNTILLNESYRLYGGKLGDDTTACTIRIRQREVVNLIIGPPSNREDCEKMMSLFFSKEGKHIVCGGTTSSIAAEYLGKPLKVSMKYEDPHIPAMGEIEGVDLVTEGVITINKVLFYAKDYLDTNETYVDWSYKRDGASLIARALFEDATDINFFVGRAVNPAHQNPGLPINFSIKMQLVNELTECLKKMGKHIKVSYF